MTDTDPSGRGCERFAEMAPELALGALDGRDRADALAHLHDCAHCQRHLAGYNELADGLLDLVPAAEPPAGFETRVLALIAGSRPAANPAGAATNQIAASGAAAVTSQTVARGRTATTGEPGASLGAHAGRRVRHRGVRGLPGQRRTLAAVAAAVAVAIGLTGYGLGHRGGGDGALRRATLSAAGHQVGEAFFYGGAHPWVYMGVSTGLGDETVTCELTRQGRRGTTSIGSFTLASGNGSWGAQAPTSLRGVTGAVLIDSTGATVAEGTFGK